jgi:hypothetical protein
MNKYYEGVFLFGIRYGSAATGKFYQVTNHQLAEIVNRPQWRSQ